ncbi:unnamed protein product [Pieris macdunnoughi]|uniref:Uncharacterized protein n=1 Tax=Pieris macdunnoughi TaxID=345717 RepID=A0A821QAN8_9NEOP|nr:unnamed protein product [Pieris macdunnoughi]
MSANNCDSMTYFSNAYMPDMRNGGGHDHQQAHAHYGAVPQQGHELEGCDPQLRPAQHHYSAQTAPGMPYPRFPPYDRLGYYQQMEQNGYRPDSPSQMGHMGPKTDGYGPNGHQPPAPAVYTSCKLQAAAATAGGVPGSPPLEQAQQMPHHMHPQQHMVQHGVPPHQQHLMYPVDDMQHQTQMPPMHQQSMHGQQAPPQQAPPNTNASLPSPLYPWMRSQFDPCQIFSGAKSAPLALGETPGDALSRGEAHLGALMRSIHIDEVLPTHRALLRLFRFFVTRYD